MNNNNKSWYYDAVEFPKSLPPDDFWGQVRRTYYGKPFPQEQVDLIISMIRQGLCFQAGDVLLDICCGNGRLGFEFFKENSGYLGVDLSPILIEVAKKNFERPLTHNFLLQDVQEYCQEELHPEKFTKLLCYGAIHLFSQKQVIEIFTLLYQRFAGLKRLFIGAIPDKEKAELFFKDIGMEALPTDDYTSSIGIWYTRDDFKNMIECCGWEIMVSEMPPAFYQSHYRYNAILVRR